MWSIASVPPSSQKASLLPETQEDEIIDMNKAIAIRLNQNGSIAKSWKCDGQCREAFLKSCMSNEFVVSAFKNANMDSDSRYHASLTPSSGETFMKKQGRRCSVGCKKEK